MGLRNLQELSSRDIEESENLTLAKLKELDVSDVIAGEVRSIIESYSRPKESFLDLMTWVEKNFSYYLNDSKVEKFVHNKIVIDGQFLSFCQSNGVKVEALLRDSNVSWRGIHDFEKFFAQGIFRITQGKTQFLHCALFHKGIQNEDEIGLFNIIPTKHLEAYLKLRNSFEDWVSERDRGNLLIKVIDGEDQPYTRDHDWNDLFLPSDLKKDIKDMIENFLDNKDFYLQNKLSWKRGALLYGPAGTGKSSLIRTIIANYNFKPITIDATAGEGSMKEAFRYAEEQSPSLLYFEDLDSLLQKMDISTFLNLMDGISSKNGLFVIATANDISNFKANIMDRPSRFDRKFKIPLPNEKMSALYLKKWFGKNITPQKTTELAKHAVKYEFSYAYLKELYIASMFEALSKNRKVPTAADISKSLDRLMQDKNISKFGRKLNTDKYFKE